VRGPGHPARRRSRSRRAETETFDAVRRIHQESPALAARATRISRPSRGAGGTRAAARPASARSGSTARSGRRRRT
jgi:hypothetical protein